jgi:peptide/nickel transport system substrate-binding protein
MRIVTILGAAATVGFLALTYALSGDTGAAANVREGGTFRIADGSGLVNTIDPALVSTFTEGEILRPACGSLMSFPDKKLPGGLRVEPELAQGYPVVSQKGKTYTFTIRKDAHFSSGEAVLARDFVHALERILDPALKAQAAVYFMDVVGAREMLAGKATTLRGAVAVGRKLVLHLTRPVPDFVIGLAGPPASLCAVPANLPADPEGAKAPLASAAPYYVVEFIPGERVVLERNRFYVGPRPHHVDRFVVDLGADSGTLLDQLERGEIDYGFGPPTFLTDQAAALGKRYGVNKSQFLVVPATGVRMFALNTSRPLFRGNVALRRAVNFAVDRKALTRELGPYAGTISDQFLTPAMPGYRKVRIYPLVGPDLRRARALAKGNTRSGKAVLYTTDSPADVAQAQILRQNLQQIGVRLTVKKFPLSLLFEKLSKPGEPFDIGRISWTGLSDPGFLSFLFDGRSIGDPQSGNWSYFNSPAVNRKLDAASRLTGAARYRAFGELDIVLSRDHAPAIPYGVPNALTFVSADTGCAVVNPTLDLTAVCLK